MKRSTKILLAAMAGLLLLSEGFYISKLVDQWVSYPTVEALLQAEFVIVFYALTLPLVALHFVRRIVVDRRLVAEGEVAIGRVTGWWNGMKGFVLELAFEDATGHSHRIKSFDMTGSMAKDMQVVVFYNAANPEESTAICGAFYEACGPENDGRG